MTKIDKVIQAIIQNRSVSYADAERVLKRLGFGVIVCGSHHVFRKRGYVKNVSIKKRPKLLPYQIRDIKEVLIDHGY